MILGGPKLLRSYPFSGLHISLNFILLNIKICRWLYCPLMISLNKPDICQKTVLLNSYTILSICTSSQADFYCFYITNNSNCKLFNIKKLWRRYIRMKRKSQRLVNSYKCETWKQIKWEQWRRKKKWNNIERKILRLKDQYKKKIIKKS